MEAASLAQRLAWLCLAAVVCSSAGAAQRAEPATAVYVAPYGRDEWPGTRARPFRSLRRAQQASRALRQRRPDARIIVNLREGVYRLIETWTLDERDSGRPGAPTLFQATPGEHVILTGGHPVRLCAQISGSVLRGSLPAVPFATRRVRLVVAGGKRLEPARYPNADPGDPNGGRWAYVDGKRYDMYADSPLPEGAQPPDPAGDFWQRNIPELTRRLQLRLADRRRWARPAELEVSIFPRFNWNHYVLGVEGIDAGGTLRLAQGSFYEIRPGDRFFVRNAAEELDAPGEWYADAASRTLKVVPPKGVRPGTVDVARVGDLVRLSKCSHVTLRGLTLECAEQSGVVLSECRDVMVAGCTIKNVGDVVGSGIVVEGGRGNRLVGNDIHDTGHHGIQLGGGEHFTLSPGANMADNNYIHHVGRVARHGAGILLTGARNVVRHTLIHDIPHSGIVVWGAGHKIGYNRIRHTCLETEDAGGIGGGAIDWLSWQDTDILYNWIQDTMGYGYDTSLGRWRSPYFATALYPDWAASGVRIIGNVLLRAPRSCLLLHSGRDNVVRNNILLDGGETQAQLLGWTTATGFWSTMVDGWVRNYQAAKDQPAWRKIATLKDPRTVPVAGGLVMTGNVLEHNIIAYRSNASTAFALTDVPLDLHRSDSNIVFNYAGPVRTGLVQARRDAGPNLLANHGMEEGPSDGLPAGWAWAVKGRPDADIAIDADVAHTGRRSLRVTHGPEAGATVGLTMVAPGPSVPFTPGRTYRFSAWMRSGGRPASTTLQAYAWKQNVHNWTVGKTVEVADQWRRYELVFRLPDRSSSLYRPSMDTLYVRFTIPTTTGRIWVDDVDLRQVVPEAEWVAWKRLGPDARSVQTDPRFANIRRDDLRLKRDSPALKLGFRPIPYERIGPYASVLRASWPIREAEGAREALAAKRPTGAFAPPKQERMKR